MRLDVLDHEHRLRVRMFFSFAELTSRVPMSDVPKTLLYRPEFLGTPLLDLSAEMMRGPSFWTAGEREYMAMFTAQLQQCPFCVESHTEMIKIASNGEIDAADPGSARPELTAVLALLEKVTTTPDDVSAADIPQGVGREAVLDALHVNLIWNVVNRLANAFGFQLGSEEQLLKGTKSLHRFGYRFPGFLTGPTNGTTTGERHSRLARNLRTTVFEAPGKTDPATRRAAATGELSDAPWASYAAKVRDSSFRVTDTDIADLKSAGLSEDEIFEITAAAAVGAALRSLDAGLRAVPHA
ncbi:carboxymuconolactone decarboxylase family protein [Lentzea sp. HUAS TT2]|uniref:carboxymuconolactone decarboxylase family protein n=1 Tax=Lentzea sp. HUAS TT2 TaxID=3447454 RepID=UPI003F720E28